MTTIRTAQPSILRQQQQRAVESAVVTGQATTEAQVMQTGTRLPDGVHVDTDWLNQLKRTSPDMHRTLTTKGYGAYVEQVSNIGTTEEIRIGGKRVSYEDMERMSVPQDTGVRIDTRSVEDIMSKHGVNRTPEQIHKDYEMFNRPATEAEQKMMDEIVRQDRSNREAFSQLVKEGVVPGNKPHLVGVDKGVIKYIPDREARQQEYMGQYRVRVSEQRAAKTVQRQLEPYKTGEGTYNIALAMAEGVSAGTLSKAGFTQAQIYDKTQREMVKFYKASDKERFTMMQKSGQIPKNAQFVKVDQKGHIQYTLPEASKEITGLLKKDKLTYQEAMQVSLMTDVAVQHRIGELVVSVVPVAGTMYYWEGMSTSLRAVSISLDVIAVATPFVASRVITAIRTIGKSKYMVKIQDVINDGYSSTKAMLKSINPKLVEPFTKTVKAQQEYARVQTKVAQLEKLLQKYPEGKKGAIPSQRISKAQLVKALDNLHDQADVARVKLISSAEDYVKMAKPVADDPLTLKQFNSIPTDLVKSTDSLIQRTVNPRTLNVIQADLIRAQKSLEVAKAKWPTNPGKWTDLVQNVTSLESELLTRQVGNVGVLHQQLVHIRETIPQLQRMIKTAKATNSAYLDDLKDALVHAKLQERITERQIDAAVKSMEVEWGRGGFLGRGRIPITTRTPVRPYTGGGGVKPQRIEPFIAAVGVEGAKVVVPGEGKEPAIGKPLGPYGPETIRVKPHLEVEAPVKEPEVIPDDKPAKPKVWPIYPPKPLPYSPGIERMPWPMPVTGPKELRQAYAEVVPEAAPSEARTITNLYGTMRESGMSHERASAAITGTFTAAVPKMGTQASQAIHSTISQAKASYEGKPLPRITPAPGTSVLPVPGTTTGTVPETTTEKEVIKKVTVAVRRKGAPPPVTIESTEGATGKKGTVGWRQGVVRITVNPPYKQGTDDIDYEPSAKGSRGTPQQTIKTRGGKPPKEINLGMGVVQATVTNGRNIKFRRRHIRLT